jgi:UDP-N-acetylmuramate-alanine ligase
MYYYDSSSIPVSGPYTQIENGVTSMFSSCHDQTSITEVGLPISTGLNVGDTVRTADGNIFTFEHFEFNGSLYTVNATTGVITFIEQCSAYN